MSGTIITFIIQSSPLGRVKGDTVDNCDVTASGNWKVYSIVLWGVIDWFLTNVPDILGRKMLSNRIIRYLGANLSSLLYRDFLSQEVFCGETCPTDAGGSEGIACAEPPGKRTNVVTSVRSTQLRRQTRAQSTFPHVKDSLPLIEPRPAWLISVYWHRPCKRSLPSPRGAGLHVMELQSDPPLLYFNSAPVPPQALLPSRIFQA